MNSPETTDKTMTVIEGLTELESQDGDSPRIRKLASGAGATVVRIGFRAGQSMADHQATAPILVQATTGTVRFGTAERTVTLEPGVAVHVDAGLVHNLVADTDAVVMLTILR